MEKGERGGSRERGGVTTKSTKSTKEEEDQGEGGAIFNVQQGIFNEQGGEVKSRVTQKARWAQKGSQAPEGCRMRGGEERREGRRG